VRAVFKQTIMTKNYSFFLFFMIWSNWAFAQEEGRFRFGLQLDVGSNYYQRTFHQDGAKELDQELNTFLPFRRIGFQRGYIFSMLYKPQKHNFLLGIGYRRPTFHKYPLSVIPYYDRRVHTFSLFFTQRLQIKDEISHNFRFGASCRLLQYGLVSSYSNLSLSSRPGTTLYIFHKEHPSPLIDCSYGIERVGNRGNRWLWEVNISLELMSRLTMSVLENGALMGYRSIDYRRHTIGLGITRYFDGTKPSIYKALP